MPTVLLPHLLKISEFAKKKGVSPISVYQAIKRGDIDPVLVGKSKTPFISGTDYANYKFRIYGKK